MGKGNDLVLFGSEGGLELGKVGDSAKVGANLVDVGAIGTEAEEGKREGVGRCMRGRAKEKGRKGCGRLPCAT